MDEQTVRTLMEQHGALAQGHYSRASGRHSDYYVQCALLFDQPQVGARVAQALAERCRAWEADVVLSAAVGGILPGYELARALQLPFQYCERRDGAMTLRRGFDIKPGTKVLLLEDEVMTGTSVREMNEMVQALGGHTVGIACIVDKSGGKLQLNSSFVALLTVPVTHYPATACPLCQAGVPMEPSP